MKKIFILVLFGSLLFGSYALAQNFGGGRLDSIAVGSNLGGTSLENRIGGIIRGILALVGTIFFILTIYAGVLWMTASGDETKIEKAKQIIQAAVIGLIIVMSAYTITYFVGSKLGGSTDSDGCCILSDGAQSQSFAGPQSACISEDTSITATWSSGGCP